MPIHGHTPHACRQVRECAELALRRVVSWNLFGQIGTGVRVQSGSHVDEAYSQLRKEREVGVCDTHTCLAHLGLWLLFWEDEGLALSIRSTTSHMHTRTYDTRTYARGYTRTQVRMSTQVRTMYTGAYSHAQLVKRLGEDLDKAKEHNESLRSNLKGRYGRDVSKCARAYLCVCIGC